MSKLKDIMDVDVEPLESQAYRRSREAAKLQAPLPPIAPSAETTLPSIVDQTPGAIPRRRRSNRALRPAIQPTVQRQVIARRRSSATEEGMDFTAGYHAGGSGQESKSRSPSRPSRGSEPTDGGVPVKYTPITGRVSKAKKGVPVHTCDICRPVKIFTRAEHLRRHQLSHQKPAYPCTFEDCERAFHRPDLLTRHMHRHETQGEIAYKSEDPRDSRASSDVSESRAPSMKAETPLQPPTLGSTQGSPMNPMTPRTSGSGDGAMTASSYSTITGNFSSSAGFLPDAGTGHKRSATDAQLSTSDYSTPSRGSRSARTPGGYGRVSNQNTFTRPAQPLFEEAYSEGGSGHFSGYATTPHLPLLRIPEETWVPGLSYNNSPWCSSASDSTYSAQSDSSRKYGRSGSIATLPDWSATGAAPHWSPHPMSGTPQDLRSPPFDPMLEQYDASYVSPRMTPPLSARSHHLDVPTAYGGVFTYMESVGTPTLPTFSKPVAQPFPVPSPRVSNTTGLDILRTKGLLDSQQLATATFSISTVQPQFEIYVATYWQFFHPSFPIVHKSTFDATTSQILNHAIIAIGTQYHTTPEARTTGDIMNSACKKAIECCPNWDLATRQAILLTEMFSRFRGRKISVRLSRHFEELYSRLLSESMQEHPPSLPTRNLVMGNTADTLLERFGTQDNTPTLPDADAQGGWYHFLEIEARQRLLSACFMFDVHQAMYHQQPRSKAIRDNSRPLMHIPCPENLWDASSASEWQALQGVDYNPQPLHTLEPELCPEYLLTMSSFTQSLLVCWFAAQLPLREDLNYPNDFLPRSINPEIQNFMSLFPVSPLAQTYLSLYHTPLHSLLAIAGDTWVFAKKITPPSAFHAAQACLKIWSTSLAAAQATHHACQVLASMLSQPLAMSTDKMPESTLCLSDYWSLYVCALTCWAFGNRYQNSGSNATNHLNASTPSTSLSRSSSTTPVDDISLQEETRVKAMGYVEAMLAFSVEELLTSKACVKAETQAVIEAVRWKLDGENTGARSGLLVDAVVVLGKIKEGGKGKWF